MANIIKVGGRFKNILDTKGAIADANQIEYSAEDNSSVFDKIKELESAKVENNLVSLENSDLNKIKEVGNYKITNCKNSPSEITDGYLNVSKFSNDETIKQIWEHSGEYAFRYASLIDEISKESDVLIEGDGAELNEQELAIYAGSNVSLSGYLYGHIVIKLKEGETSPKSTTITLAGLKIMSDIQEAINFPFDSKRLTIKLKENTENYIISSTKNTMVISDPSAAIISENNLEIRGNGLLAVYNNYGGHAIKGKELYIKGMPFIHVNCNNGHDGLHGSNVIDIENGFIYVKNTNDGIGTGDSGKLNVFGGKITVDGCKAAQNAFEAKGTGFIQGLDTEITLLNITSKRPFSNNVKILETVKITAPEDYSYTTTSKADYFGSGRVYYGYIKEVDKVKTIDENDQINIELTGNTYVVGGKQTREVTVDGVVSTEEASIIVEGYITNPISLTSYKSPEVYLNNAYVEVSAKAPAILYNYVAAGDTDASGKLKIKSLDGTFSYITNLANEEDGIDTDAVKSENNIDLNGNGVLYFYALSDDGIDGSTTTIRGNGSKYFLNSGRRGIKGSKLYIGCDLTTDASDKDIPDESGKSCDQFIYAYGNYYSDSSSVKENSSDIYGRNGKLKSGFIIFHKLQEGEVYAESIKAVASIDFQNNNVFTKKDVKFFDKNGAEITGAITGSTVLYSSDTEYKEIEFTISYDKVLSGEWTILRDTPDIDLNEYTTKDELNAAIGNIKTQKIYQTMDAAENDLENLEYGHIISVCVGENTEENYNADYDVYAVVKDSLNNKKLKKIQGGSGQVVGKVLLTVSDILVNGVSVFSDEVKEAKLGSVITFKYTFESEQYPDVRGTVYMRRGSDVVYAERITPDGSPTEIVYNTTGLSAGTYTFSIYGADSTGKQSDRSKYTFLIGGLSVSSTFDDTKAFIYGENINIPISVTAADSTAKIIAHVSIDDNEVLQQNVSVGSTTLQLKDTEVGSHKLKVWLINSADKISNELSYGLIVAEEGKIYIITGKDLYETGEGTKLDISVRVIQVGQEDGKFPATIEITNSNGETVNTQNHNFDYGVNNISIVNLKHTDTEQDFTLYNAKITVSLEDAPEIPSVEKEIQIKITKNDYNIKQAARENLKCEFVALGKTNSNVDRDSWADTSGNNITNSFHNFNWSTNGWLTDESGNTALTLNSGAYVELDITPFAEEIKENEEMTISIDFATKDILDSNAKVISCLQETIGDESYTYYLRDSFGDYVQRGNDNVVKYFKSHGGYCWVDGETYVATGVMDYETTMAVSERAINYNLGDENSSYDGKKDFKKKLGFERRTVTKQRGFYIDTQYAVLSHSASLSNVMDKFYLNFSEDTRTRIDFIITRNTSEVESSNPYTFQAMIGYTNGILSLMKELNPSESFQQIDTQGHKFKIYLGCKASYDENGNIQTSETGSSRIYSFRIYNKALTHEEILRNYIADIPDFETKKSLIDNNGINNPDTISKLPTLCLMGYKSQTSSTSSIQKFIMQLKKEDNVPIADLKKVKEPAYIQYMDERGTFWTDDNGNNIIPVRLQFQGTSSMVYPVKNYKFKMYKSIEEDAVGNITYGKKLKKSILGKAGFDESTFCLKADFMDSSHCNNTQSANFISDYNTVISGTTPASYLDSRVRTTIYGYPILLYYKDTPESIEKHFIGVYNLNLDKSCTTSFGLKDEMVDNLNDGKEALYEFKQIRFIDDENTKDIMVKKEVSSLTDLSDDAILTDETTQACIGNTAVQANIITDSLGNVIGLQYDGKIYKAKTNSTKTSYYIVMENPDDHVECALMDAEGRLRDVNLGKTTSTQCFEFKANSGAAGAGGFGNYGITSISTDLESRYPDDGDLEDDEYTPYVEAVGSDKAIDFKHFKAPYYYNMRRMIKWISNATKDEFLKNVDRYFNRTYLMDYYLTVLLLGAVDSLGKNLMVASWGPENHLYQTSAEALDKTNENYDSLAFEYIDNSVDPAVTMYITPKKTKSLLDVPTADGQNYEYIFAKNQKGLYLYYKEEAYNRYTKEFENGYSKWDSSIVTTVPGEDIHYPIFYDIDTINGLDNAGQLLFDVDIEVGDQLSDGTGVFNTAESHLWRRVKEYFGDSGDLASRWRVLRERCFKIDNLKKFLYTNEISKIPEKYYNKDCFLKYIYEGPQVPGETRSDGSVAKRGSGAYLYCIHGSRYEHMKRWYTQRIYYLDTMFGNMGDNNATLRFSHYGFDATFESDKNYYASYAILATKKPENYRYDSETGKLYAKVKESSDVTSEYEIIPINFNIKTYQPAYVGVKWSNSGKILMYRVSRDEVINIKGNVPANIDAEVFIYGDKNIKELGDLSPYNVKQVNFTNLSKLSKLVLGSKEFSTVINSIELGDNTYLADLQVTNCSSLTTLNLSQCTNLRSIEMTGSGITSLTLPSGGALESIYYSDAITNINLKDFVNLSYVNTPNLTNLTSLVIKNCPKILGTPTSRNAKGWALLQQTRLSTNLNTIDITSYGTVDPVISGGKAFFFADKYWNYGTSKNIRGEVYYTGTSIPENYSKFATAYPRLKIYYQNITDGSNMFANYQNLNCVSRVRAYTGNDQYGNPKYSDILYWTDNTDELKEKWHSQTAYNNYGYSTTYTKDNLYYLKDGVYYRPLGIRDKNDLDILRAEIKKNLEAFNGSKFKNVSGMFKNIAILDYLDPDTFNGVDLSEATTDSMFEGCTNLRYFTLPNDISKNEPVYKYFNLQPDGDYEEVSYDDWDPSTGKMEQSTNSLGQFLYRDIFEGKETTEATTIYRKGIRTVGDRMFYNCKRVRVLIPRLSGTNKICISTTAFEYKAYDPSLESQDINVNCERPAIMFELEDTDLLKTTTNSEWQSGNTVIKNQPTGTEGLYFYINENNQRELNYENSYIDFRQSNRWFREVYFGVSEIVINDETKEEGFSISYAKRNDGQIIVIDVSKVNQKSELTEFNKPVYETTEEANSMVMKNSLNIYSYTQGAFVNIADSVLTYEMPLPKQECFDAYLPRQEYEYSMLQYFTNGNYTDFSAQVIEKLLPAMENIFIYNTETITKTAFFAFTKLKIVGITASTKEIQDAAFKGCTAMDRICWDRRTLPTYEQYFGSKTNIEVIGNNTFESTNISEIFLPNTLTELGREAFYNCIALTNVQYSNNLTYIPEACFRGCSTLISVSNISTEKLTKIENYAFYNCKNLVFSKNVLGQTNWNRLDWDYSIYTSLTKIGAYAFYNCSTLIAGEPDKDSAGNISNLTVKKLILPDTLKEIGGSAFYQEGNVQQSNNIEIVWSGNNFSELIIGNNTFMNIRFSWTPDGYTTPIEDTVYIPGIASIGSDSFKPRDINTPFKLALAAQSEEEIATRWVSNADKILYNFIGMKEINDAESDFLTTFLFAKVGSNNYAYVYYIHKNIASYTIPKTVGYNSEEYIVKELLSGCLALSTTTLFAIYFPEDSGVDVIESNVLTSAYLYIIDNLPENIEIKTGNMLKGTSWYQGSSAGFVKLGKYVIGYVPSSESDKLTSIDFNSSELSTCEVVYDSAR